MPSPQLVTTHNNPKALARSLTVSVFPVPAGPAGAPPRYMDKAWHNTWNNSVSIGIIKLALMLPVSESCNHSPNIHRELKLRLIWATHVNRKRQAFSFLMCLEATKFVLLNFFNLIETIYPEVWEECKKPLPAGVRTVARRCAYLSFLLQHLLPVR